MRVFKSGDYLYHLYQIEGNYSEQGMILEIFRAIKYYYRAEIFIKGETDYEYIRKFLNVNVEIENTALAEVDGKDYTLVLVRLDLRLDSNFSRLKQLLIKMHDKVDDEGFKSLVTNDYDRLLKDLTSIWKNKTYNSPFGSEMKVIDVSNNQEAFDYKKDSYIALNWHKNIENS